MIKKNFSDIYVSLEDIKLFIKRRKIPLFFLSGLVFAYFAYKLLCVPISFPSSGMLKVKEAGSFVGNPFLKGITMEEPELSPVKIFKRSKFLKPVAIKLGAQAVSELSLYPLEKKRVIKDNLKAFIKRGVTPVDRIKFSNIYYKGDEKDYFFTFKDENHYIVSDKNHHYLGGGKVGEENQLDGMRFTLEKPPETLQIGREYKVTFTPISAAIKQIKDSIEVLRDLRVGSLYQVTVSTRHPELSKEIADAILHQYNFYGFEKDKKEKELRKQYFREKKEEVTQDYNRALDEYSKFVQGLIYEEINPLENQLSQAVSVNSKVNSTIASLEEEMERIHFELKLEKPFIQEYAKFTGEGSQLEKIMHMQQSIENEQRIDADTISFYQNTSSPILAERLMKWNALLDQLPHVQEEYKLKRDIREEQKVLLSFLKDLMPIFYEYEDNKKWEFSGDKSRAIKDVENMKLEIGSALKSYRDNEAYILQIRDTIEKLKNNNFIDIASMPSQSVVLRDLLEGFIGIISTLEKKELYTKREIQKLESELEAIKEKILFKYNEIIEQRTILSTNIKYGILKLKAELVEIIDLKINDLKEKKDLKLRNPDRIKQGVEDWKAERMVKYNLRVATAVLEQVTRELESDIAANFINLRQDSLFEKPIASPFPKRPELFFKPVVFSVIVFILTFIFLFIWDLLRGLPVSVASLNGRDIFTIGPIYQKGDLISTQEQLHHIVYNFPKDKKPLSVLVNLGKYRDFSKTLIDQTKKTGKRVLVIDCTFVSPLRKGEKGGLASFLRGESDTVACELKDGVYYISSGGTEPDHTELLGSERFANWAREQSRDFDVVMYLAKTNPGSAKMMPLMKHVDFWLLGIKREKVDELLQSFSLTSRDADKPYALICHS